MAAEGSRHLIIGENQKQVNSIEEINVAWLLKAVCCLIKVTGNTGLTTSGVGFLL